MRFFEFLKIFLLALLVTSPLAASSEQEASRAAEMAAIEWVALVDAKKYEDSWAQAASLFRNAVSSSDWARAVSALRGPLGEAVTRELVSATYATSLPGAPDGEYVLVQFQTTFENKATAIETVTAMLDNGRWRVSGYFVR